MKETVTNKTPPLHCFRLHSLSTSEMSRHTVTVNAKPEEQKKKKEE